MTEAKTTKLWGARFADSAAQILEEFNASIVFDCKLYKQDIEGSIAHTKMLAATKIISETDFNEIQRGLQVIQKEIEEIGVEEWAAVRIHDEDIHLAIEKRLIELIGETAKKMHTSRSRNDQVITDLRLWLRDAIKSTTELLIELRQAFIQRAELDYNIILPGYTHMQHAQPISLGHFWLAHEARLTRDTERLFDSRKRSNVNPLGSGALSGTTFAIDREMTTKELGFDRPSENSLDAVSDRDFVAEYEFILSMIMIHLSQWAEEMIIFNTKEFAFIEIDDAYATGSSMMPQKKNPDIPELIRGKTGRVIGALNALMITLKSLPMAYNKDLQEDKEMLFMAHETTQKCLKISKDFLEHIKPNQQRMYDSIYQSYADATDVVDYLVRKQVPFRTAYEAVGSAVKYAIERKRMLKELSQSEWSSFHPAFSEDISGLLKPENCVDARNITGGTAREQVKKAIEFAHKRARNDAKL
jgi:argininosuccinate lyase